MSYKKYKLALPMALAALVASQSVLAKSSQYFEHIREACDMISEDLLRSQHYDNNCSFYMSSAGDHLKHASLMISKEQYKQAVIDLVRAEERLRTAESQPEKCAYFSSIARGYIGQVMMNKDALERLELNEQ